MTALLLRMNRLSLKAIPLFFFMAARTFSVKRMEIRYRLD